MPTRVGGYHLADGTRVPSVSTIIGRFKDSGALMKWAHAQGIAGKPLYEEAQKAAEVGTVVHAMVEASIKCEYPLFVLEQSDLTDEQRQKAMSAFDAYKAWASNYQMRVIEQECQMVSEEHRFGGCPDIIATIGNELALIDIKTSNAIYADYLVQVAAYGLLWEECRPGQKITGGFHILRFSKENADFVHAHFPKLDEAREQFLLFLKCYQIDKVLKKRAA